MAIRAALETSGGIWFGWSGRVEEKAGDEPALVVRGPLTYATLDLSRRELEEYYLGFANRVLWPLFRFAAPSLQYSRRYSAGYLRVNRRFARTLAPMLLPQDLVWVHDYHLIPLGRELVGSTTTSRLAFFCIRRFRQPNCYGCWARFGYLSRRCVPTMSSAFRPSRTFKAFAIICCA